ncbi:unnamed protein product, partial [Polarella glacialis]
AALMALPRGNNPMTPMTPMTPQQPTVFSDRSASSTSPLIQMTHLPTYPQQASFSSHSGSSLLPQGGVAPNHNPQGRPIPFSGGVHRLPSAGAHYVPQRGAVAPGGVSPGGSCSLSGPGMLIHPGVMSELRLPSVAGSSGWPWPVSLPRAGPGSAASPAVSAGTRFAQVAVTSDVAFRDSFAFANGEAIMGRDRPSIIDYDKWLVTDGKPGTSLEDNQSQVAESDEAPDPAHSDDDHDDDVGYRYCCGWITGMQQWSPELYSWFIARMGTKKKVFLVLSFMALEALKHMLSTAAYSPGVNVFSLLAISNLSSLVLATFISFLLEGGHVLNKLLSWHHFWRFMLSALLFTVASALVLTAYLIGTGAAEVVTVGHIHMPISVVLSYYVFGRRYGKLEWISVGMMTLSILAFVLLRQEAICKQRLEFTVDGFLLVLAAVYASVMGSILAERIFKDKSIGLVSHDYVHDRFYIMKFHLDLSSFTISVLLWALPSSTFDRTEAVFFQQWAHTKDWFGDWGPSQYLMVAVMAGQGWAAGLITKEFSTVIRSIVQTLACVLVFMIGDPLRHNRNHFERRWVPSALLTSIIFLSAIIFQTGRVNLKVIRKAFNLDMEAHRDLGLGAVALSEAHPGPSTRQLVRDGDLDVSQEGESEGIPLHVVVSSSRSGLLNGGPQPGTNSTSGSSGSKAHLAAEEEAPRVDGYTWDSMAHMLTTYALILVYIISDAGRTITLQKALSTTVTNSTSMGLVCYVLGVIVASCLTLFTHGQAGLRLAMSPRKILYCLPAAFLFALATALGNLAFAMGISSGLYVVLGKFYTPVAALGARQTATLTMTLTMATLLDTR